LPNLKNANISFTLELFFVTLYGQSFYSNNNIRASTVNLPTSSKVLKRPSPKVLSSIEPLNKEFYDRIDNARIFRNTITHNENNKEEQKKQLQEKLSKKPKLRKSENDYDGIIEAVNWLIRQLYCAMTK
jgi:hypothetical protein